MRRILLLTLALTLGLFIFSGCNNMDNPAEPEVYNLSNNLSVNSLNCNETYDDIYIDENGHGYIYFINEMDNYSEYLRVNPSYKHFLLDIIYWIETDQINFSKNKSIPFKMKIKSLIIMIDIENLEGAKTKLTNDVFPKLDEWIETDDHRDILNIYLTWTLWMLEHPEQELFVPQALWSSIPLCKAICLSQYLVANYKTKKKFNNREITEEQFQQEYNDNYYTHISCREECDNLPVED